MKYENTARDNGYETNKDVPIMHIDSIYIQHFRTLKNKTIPLGKNITLISGKNGTMKTSVMGLIAHPFSSVSKASDFFGEELKTPMSKVFRMSHEKDDKMYRYALNITTTDNISFTEPIRMYPRPTRHRITVGRDNTKGYGNFILNTAYINFKRLYPLIETNAVEYEINPVEDKALISFVRHGYLSILGQEAFSSPVPVSEEENRSKSTFGPGEADYDYNSISSGEDNLGHILLKMYAFQEYKYHDPSNRRLQGVFCIDEIEAGLHPIAQENLFNFLLHWSEKHNIQIVATTHSLYLIQHALMNLNEYNHSKNSITVNMFSTAFVSNKNYNIITNPSYTEAYKELTFKGLENLDESYKIRVFCEDDMAKYFTKKIIKTTKINSRLDFIYGITSDFNNPGTSCAALKSLARNAEQLFMDSIIIYDPEVDDSFLKGSRVTQLKLPSLYLMPIEKEIVKFINDLDGGHDFFKHFDRERGSFINAFTDYKIYDLTTVQSCKNTKTLCFKNWARSDKKFKQYVTYYSHYNADAFSKFRIDLINSINEQLKGKSLPTFEL